MTVGTGWLHFDLVFMNKVSVGGLNKFQLHCLASDF